MKYLTHFQSVLHFYAPFSGEKLIENGLENGRETFQTLKAAHISLDKISWIIINFSRVQ